MKVEDFFSQHNIIDLSFFNFSNAITAAYFAKDVLEQLGIPGQQIEQFVEDISKKGSVLIPQVNITINGEERVYSLLSARTHDDSFSYLNGVQGQFVDRTAEWELRREREELLEQKIRDREIIEEKTRQLESLATRLAKYLSPQIYQSIFSDQQGTEVRHARKNLTLFFSDIVQFTDLTDTMEPERLATVINSYLSEMSIIALESGGTIDKFIGDAILVFFGDPESEGETEDALKCVEMALRMKQRIQELQKHWKKLGASNGLRVRMGISSGYCTVGNFGSDLRLDYTVLGSPVNLAARLEAMANPGAILVDENTHALIGDQVVVEPFDTITPKGFARPLKIFQVEDFKSMEHRKSRRRLSHMGERVEVNVLDSSDIRAAIEELRRIQQAFEQELQ